MKKIILLSTVLFCFLQFAKFPLRAQTLYGTTFKGGNDGQGTINKFTPATNNLTVAKSLEGFAANPFYTNFIQASDGKLYGMTYHGGSSNAGVIFSFDPSSSTYTKLKDFDIINGYPLGSLMQASDGKLYGMTTLGGVFSFDPSSSTYTKLKGFDLTQGADPSGNLMQASDGKLYGMTTKGGSGYGVIFSFDPSSSTFTKLKDFDNTNGGYPYGSLMQASDGKLYGMTHDGGGSYAGVIFSFDPSSSAYTKVKDFDYTNGGYPFGSLMQASDGKLYGITSQGGSSGVGVIFSFDLFSSGYAKLLDFNNTNGANPSGPSGSLMQANDGKLYGMTKEGGSGGDGVIFAYDPSTSTYTKLKDFDDTDGKNPFGSLIQASNGKLYGMTAFAGSGGDGVIFSYEPLTSAYTKFKDFGTNESGSNVSASLMQASDGKLYGMTTNGGSFNVGVIFSFDPSSQTYTKLKDFDRANDFTNGIYPYGSLVQATDGKLYGMTSSGGSFYGVIFSFDPSSSTYTKLKDFDIINGGFPRGTLIQASDGKLYGMTQRGGSRDRDLGVIFSFDPSSSTYTKLVDFDGTNGASPYGSLMQASDGKLYGMTTFGGNSRDGVIFSYDPSSSTYTKLKDFDPGDYGNPYGSLIQASNGKLYGMTGTTLAQERTGDGIIFSFDPSNSTYTKLKDFDNTNGSNPYGDLMEASDGKLYGMTNGGGSSGRGVIFSFDPSSSNYVKLQDFNGTNGANPYFGSAFIEVSESNNVVLSCPSSGELSTDKGRCDAIVNNIDPVLQGDNTQINYTLSGATVASGTGSVSGKIFNKGVTTVTYSLANDASKNCSFTITVNDKEPPSITNVVADPATLWPPNHKLHDVTISYDVSDNCGFNSPALSVSGNEAIENSADWIVADNHHVQLRAEKGKSGSERIYTVTISVTDLSGNQSIKTINISVPKNKANATISAANRSSIVEEDIQSLTLKPTPNPSQNYFTLFIKSISDKAINIKVTDVLGRVVETRLNIAANEKLRLGSNYRQGIYFVEVIQGIQRQLVKLVKQ